MRVLLWAALLIVHYFHHHLNHVSSSIANSCHIRAGATASRYDRVCGVLIRPHTELLKSVPSSERYWEQSEVEHVLSDNSALLASETLRVWGDQEWIF